MLFVDNVSCSRGGRIVYEKVSFSLEEGSSILLLGANGSGKSTLLRQIAGFLPLHDGSITMKKDNDFLHVSDNSYYVGHLDGVKTSLTVLDNISFWSDIYGGDKYKALEYFGLDYLLDTPVSMLSAGQKRKLGLSRLLLDFHPLWLLDEPSNSLDKNSCKLLSDLMSNHVKNGGMLISSTHTDFAMKFTQNVNMS